MPPSNSKNAGYSNANYGDFFKFFGDFKLPNFDYNSIFSIQRRNIEAFSTANQVINEGFQAVARRQAEMLKSNIEELLGAARELSKVTSPEGQATKQAQLAKNLYERVMVHVRELAEMASRSNIEAFDVVNRRVTESLEEVSKLTKNAA